MSSVTPTKPEASVAGLSLSRVGRLLASPEIYLCRECQRLNMVGAVCDCGGTVNQTAREKAEATRPVQVDEEFNALVEAFGLVEDLDEPGGDITFSPVAYHACPVCLGDGEIPAEDGRGWMPCPNLACRRMNVVRVEVAKGGPHV